MVSLIRDAKILAAEVLKWRNLNHRVWNYSGTLLVYLKSSWEKSISWKLHKEGKWQSSN